MRLAISLLAAATLLAVPSSAAQAKELQSARACDDDGCRTITDRAALRRMEEGQAAPAPAAGSPFHRIRMSVKVERDKSFRFAIAYVPSERLLRFRGEGGGYDWLAPPPRALRVLERLTRGLDPLPARRLRGVGPVEEPVAHVDEVVPAAVARDDGGFPWMLPLLLGALALGLIARRVTKARGRGTGGHGPLARQDVP